jgi:hypothetical protein
MCWVTFDCFFCIMNNGKGLLLIICLTANAIVLFYRKYLWNPFKCTKLAEPLEDAHETLGFRGTPGWETRLFLCIDFKLKARLLCTECFCAPPKHRVLEHQLLKHRLVEGVTSIKSTRKKIDCTIFDSSFGFALKQVVLLNYFSLT